MEPHLCDGDVLLVRKSDILSDFILTSGEHDTDCARIKRLETAVNGQPDHPILSKPPVVLAGQVVVLTSPNMSQYQVKRVVGLGGQLIRPGNRFQAIESIPAYSLWVEGDNRANSEDSNVYGPISKKLLVGQAERIVWPPSRWSRIKRIPPVEGKAWWP
jgi:hypothetical protein